MGESRGSYRIAVGGDGDVTVLDPWGKQVFTHSADSPRTDPEVQCDALLEALSWTAQHHSGRLVVELPEKGLANGLVGARPIDNHSRLATMIDEARALLTWFESTDVALCDADARLS